MHARSQRIDEFEEQANNVHDEGRVGESAELMRAVELYNGRVDAGAISRGGATNDHRWRSH